MAAAAARPAPIRRAAALLAGAALATLAWAGAGAPAAAAQSTGSIAGAVTLAAGGGPLEGVQVCAEPLAAVGGEDEEVEEPPPSCAATGAGGAYAITGLQPGSYAVLFNPPPFLIGSTAPYPDYVAQLYEHAAAAADLKPVDLAAGASVEGVDAALERGGEISGSVSAREGGALANAAVCAVAAAPAEPLLGGFDCALTGPAGEYLLSGLAAGSYLVSFAAAGREPQIYDGRSQLSEATPVVLAAGGLVEGVDASLGPAQQGSPAPAGASPSGAPAGAAGSLPTGAALAQPPLSLLSRVLATRRGRSVAVALRCRAGSACRGSLLLSAAARAGRGREREVTLGSAVFSLAAGARATVEITLDRFGRTLLAGAGPRRAGRLTVTLSGPAGTRAQVLAVQLARTGRAAVRP